MAGETALAKGPRRVALGNHVPERRSGLLTVGQESMLRLKATLAQRVP